MQEKTIIIFLLTIIITLVAWIFNSNKKSTDNSLHKTHGEHKDFITKEIHILKEKTLWLRVQALFVGLERKVDLQTSTFNLHALNTEHSIKNMQSHIGLIMEKLGIIDERPKI